jgi:hypothetical protein
MWRDGGMGLVRCGITTGGYSLEMSSLVVFSINVRRLAMFYGSVLGAEPIEERSGDIRLINERHEILIHSIPKKIARDIEITSPPAPRDNSALKPVFDVASLERALRSVEGTGGVVTSRGFSLDGLTRRDVLDPDGNVIQLRSRMSEPISSR